MEGSMGLVTGVPLVERARTPTVTAGGGRPVTACGCWDLGGGLIYALTSWGVGTVEIWKGFRTYGKSLFLGADGLWRGRVAA